MSYKAHVFFLLILFFLALPLGAQQSMRSQDINTVDVESLSDEQIQQLIRKATDQGLSIEQALQIAQAQGASATQITKIRERIRATQSGASSLEKRTGLADKYDLATDAQLFSDKAAFDEKLIHRKIYGFQFFNSEKLSFEPSVNIPIPKSYVLSSSDELIINIWGASQQVYELTVDQSGAIYIPGVGQIQVGGMQLDQARTLIHNRLKAIYSGMSGSNPNTWADISIQNLRAIKVSVLGEVMVPGTYTLPATASAFNALYLSGGPNETGSFRNIQVIRDNKVLQTIDVYDYLIHSNPKSNVVLRDNDILMIPPYEARVDMQGSFKRNGFFEWKKGETLSHMIAFAGGFDAAAYKASLSVVRYTDSQRMILDVDADEFNRFVPQDGDSITAGQVLQRYNNRVHISGAVFRPGTYSLVDGMKLIDLIQRAQGVTEDVFNNRGIVFRLGKDLTPTALAFDVAEVLNRNKDIVLQREDSVVIQDLFSMREERYVRIMGEVQEQGMYPYSEGMTINDLIFQAGGLKEAASESFIEISRRHSYERAASPSNDLVELYQFDISRSLKLADDDARFVMKPFDYVYIRKAPSYFEQKTVTIEGEILYPGQYSIQSKTERISDLIRRAGGLTPHAYVDGATLFRKVDESDLDTAMLSNLVVDTLVEKAARQLSSGRVEVQLSEILKDTTSIYNYHLKEGDRILIPEVSEEVHVVGAILNPVGLAYERGKRANYYINRSGGFSDQANSRKVYVINSDGTTEVTKTFLFRRYPKVSPGSKIMVPEKPEKEGVPVATWLAIASTFSSLAIAIAAIMP